MPKNVLFSLQIVKIAKRWGSTPRPLASGGWELRPQTPTSIILHCEFSLASAHKAQTISELTRRPHFVIIAGVHQAFGVEYNCSAFRIIPQTTEIITIGFNFFRFVPPPTLILR